MDKQSIGWNSPALLVLRVRLKPSTIIRVFSRRDDEDENKELNNHPTQTS
jgi:hypothetical protein